MALGKIMWASRCCRHANIRNCILCMNFSVLVSFFVFQLSPTTLQGLHQIVQMVQIGDYTGGLSLHTQLVSGSDFSQIASFMPGLKVLLQSALQLQVYLQ